MHEAEEQGSNKDDGYFRKSPAVEVVKIASDQGDNQELLNSAPHWIKYQNRYNVPSEVNRALYVADNKKCYHRDNSKRKNSHCRFLEIVCSESPVLQNTFILTVSINYIYRPSGDGN